MEICRLSIFCHNTIKEINLKKMSEKKSDVKTISNLKDSKRLKILEDIRTIENNLMSLAYSTNDTMNYKNKLHDYSNQLKDIRNSIESLMTLGVIDDQSSIIEHFSNQANNDLADRVRSENIFNNSLRDIIDKTLLTYEIIVLRLIDRNFYVYDSKQPLHFNIYQNISNILELFTKENLIYIGIGLIFISFLLYFIIISQ